MLNGTVRWRQRMMLPVYEASLEMDLELALFDAENEFEPLGSLSLEMGALGDGELVVERGVAVNDSAVVDIALCYFDVSDFEQGMWSVILRRFDFTSDVRPVPAPLCIAATDAYVAPRSCCTLASSWRCSRAWASPSR